jgi:hypothetical protein
VWGPYVQPDKFIIGGTDNDPTNGNFSDATINDRDNHPILYYVAAPGAAINNNNVKSGGYVGLQAPTASGYATRPMYNAYDNATYLSLAELQFILGDRDNSGYIDAGESATTTAPFLLWSAGADGKFGRLNGKTDDVTNFDIPPDLRK